MVADSAIKREGIIGGSRKVSQFEELRPGRGVELNSRAEEENNLHLLFREKKY